MTKKIRPPHHWDQSVADNAVAYTACVFIGRGQYDHREFPNCADAREVGGLMAAAYGKPAMIYAVDAQGCSTHIENVAPAKGGRP